jgi:hypothetical protein
MLPRRIEVFFYGLFMDADLLRSKGAGPVKIRPACAPGFALRIGERATLFRNPESRAYGILMELTHDEIDHLYSEASVRAYRPEAVLCELGDGSRVRLTAEEVKNLSALSGVAYRIFGAVLISLVAPNPAPKVLGNSCSRLELHSSLARRTAEEEPTMLLFA